MPYLFPSPSQSITTCSGSLITGESEDPREVRVCPETLKEQPSLSSELPLRLGPGGFFLVCEFPPFGMTIRARHMATSRGHTTHHIPQVFSVSSHMGLCIA